MIKRAWWLVTPTTIQNCFRKGGFLQDPSSCSNMTDEDDEVTIDLAISETEFLDYLRCDDELECYGSLTDEEILHQVADHGNNEFMVEEESEETTIPTVTRKEAICAVNTL